MSERTRILLSSIAVMAVISLSVATLAIGLLYRASFVQYRARLAEIVQHRADIDTAVATFDHTSTEHGVPGPTGEPDLDTIIEVHRRFATFGQTGEFTIARREGDEIVWLLRERDQTPERPETTPFDSEWAEPMRRALRGESGTLVGLDYRGARVLAAYEPMPEIGWGAVAKIDVAEIVQPFLRAGLLAAGIAFLVVAGGVALMLRVTSPLVRRIEERVAQRTAELFAANAQLREEIKQRQQAEGELRRMSKVFMEAAVPIVIEDLFGQIVDANAEVERSYGWSRDELLGRSIYEITPPERHAQQRKLLARCRAGELVQNVESLRQSKAGKRIPVLLTLSILTDEHGETIGIASIAKDLSDQKGLEAELREAAAEGALAEERERRKLAVDLHDGLGQLLTVVGMKLGMLRDSTEDPQTAARVREIESVISEADERASSLSFQLSPPLLHDMGLVGAAEWLAEDMENRFGLHVTVESDGTCEMLDEARRVTLFRGLQEVLLNVVRHSRTPEAAVRIWLQDQHLNLSVEDEGVGFDPDAQSHGYGLFSLRERLTRLGGDLQIESAPGRGTRVVLTAPLGAARRENMTEEI